MPNRRHNDAITPPRRRAIWRYLDFPKFLALLESSSLFMPSLLSMAASNPYEGVLTDTYHNMNKYEPMYTNTYRFDRDLARDIQEEEAEREVFAQRYDEEIQEEGALRAHEFVSCWHMNDHASDAI